MNNNIQTEYDDVFDELDEIRHQSNMRRLSFSIPYNDDELLSNIDNSIEYPVAPPSSPEIYSNPLHNLSIEIPDSDDIFTNNGITYPQSSDDDADIHIDDIQNFINFPKSELMISSLEDRTLYKRPSRKSIDARKIWKSAKIPPKAYIYDIESLLLDWAFTHAYLEIYDKKIKKIIWKSKSNCRCESTWKTFLQWIICGSLSQ